MEKSENQRADTPSSGAAMGRALVSAAIFGTVGAWLGRWLGHHGNAPKNGMAQSFMTWGMGGFWALVAAYSSLKSSEQERKAVTERYTQEHYQPARVELLEKRGDMPANAVEASSAVAEGKAAETPRKARA